MGRYLSIDYGTKRCGIAVTDPQRIFASGLETVASHDLMKFLEDYFNKEDVECVVVGKPMRENNTPSESYIYIERFVQAFKKRFQDIPVYLEDERNTSIMARQAMVAGGMKKKDRERKGNTDKISAALILQSFLESENNRS